MFFCMISSFITDSVSQKCEIKTCMNNQEKKNPNKSEKLLRGVGDIVLWGSHWLQRRDGSFLTGERSGPEEVALLRGDNKNKGPPGGPAPGSNCR